MIPNFRGEGGRLGIVHRTSCYGRRKNKQKDFRNHHRRHAFQAMCIMSADNLHRMKRCVDPQMCCFPGGWTARSDEITTCPKQLKKLSNQNFKDSGQSRGEELQQLRKLSSRSLSNWTSSGSTGPVSKIAARLDEKRGVSVACDSDAKQYSMPGSANARTVDAAELWFCQAEDPYTYIGGKPDQSAAHVNLRLIFIDTASNRALLLSSCSWLADDVSLGKVNWSCCRDAALRIMFCSAVRYKVHLNYIVPAAVVDAHRG
ncbi:uncharacterized protein MYCFIDRAFT_177264 [Pseudocercospora fijiensis CIRAD86]|uniref:Uncharacterized protein n=1 Tax=Pseudocercospora fijiensis (strain CIRAD86) TaxID=383855 RepID=M3AS57_PSEFD|nr:uncharacterized protein MYCFIDRAFT_177264 [Pseudocercospora fijiensis CIRAD86]EME80307.1 hypothetical protein MYCFIDRAFT_177264 [Pseudocercospora fijiensis CIRAD86]